MRLSKDLAAAAAGRGNALRRAQGFLSASGVIRQGNEGVLCTSLRCGLTYRQRSPITYVSYFTIT